MQFQEIYIPTPGKVTEKCKRVGYSKVKVFEEKYDIQRDGRCMPKTFSGRIFFWLNKLIYYQ